MQSYKITLKQGDQSHTYLIEDRNENDLFNATLGDKVYLLNGDNKIEVSKHAIKLRDLGLSGRDSRVISALWKAGSLSELQKKFGLLERPKLPLPTRLSVAAAPASVEESIYAEIVDNRLSLTFYPLDVAPRYFVYKYTITGLKDHIFYGKEGKMAPMLDKENPAITLNNIPTFDLCAGEKYSLHLELTAYYEDGREVKSDDVLNFSVKSPQCKSDVERARARSFSKIEEIVLDPADVPSGLLDPSDVPD